MKLLLLCTDFDTEYLDRFQRLPSLVGHQVVKTTQVYVNPVTLDAVCDKHKIDAVICCQATALSGIVNDLPDYVAGPKPKKLTLDDYAGSLLNLRSGREVVVCNPLERLRTVAYEKFVLDRYVSKLTKKDRWYKQTKFQWELVTFEKKEAVLERLASALFVAIDIENPHPQVDIRPITCVSYTGYFPDTHTTESYVVPFDEYWHWEFCNEANALACPKVFQNGLHDNLYFMRWDLPVRNWLYDTYHLFHCWQSELPKRLDFVGAFCLREVRYWKEEGKTGQLQDLHRYCALDGYITANSLLSLMQDYPHWAAVNYVDHEFLMVYPCLTAALEGVDMDRERFEKITVEKEKEVETLRSELQYVLDEPNYNPGSPKQNANLFKLLGVGYLDGTGKIPTLKAKAAHPLNNAILTQVEDYKQAAKQVGTYFDSDKLWDNRGYYNLDPGATDTGRAASRESSFDCGWQIQNIPNADDSFKQCVIAPPGWYIAEVDKKQSEARCVGYLSGDLNLINLVESSHDYHSWNASQFFGVPYECIYDESVGKTIDKALRDLSKRTNHGANYNMGATVMLDTMGPKKVAQAKITLKLPKNLTLKAVCQYLLSRYEATYPDVKGRWYESIIQAIEIHKKLVSPLGWTRYFHGSPRNNKQHLNSAVAHAPQNLSVAIINREWYKIWRETIYGELRGKVRIKAQIHDSLLFIYRTPDNARRVAQLMDLVVPVVGSDGVTRNLYIPNDLSLGDGAYKTRWSEIK